MLPDDLPAAADAETSPPTCDCCDRRVGKVRQSHWHTGTICRACFFVWYDTGETKPERIKAAVLRAEAGNLWPFGEGEADYNRVD